MNNEKFYLDYNSTAPYSPSVENYIQTEFLNDYANPSSEHDAGFVLSGRIKDHRKNISNFLGVSTKSLIFTSGATESINTVLSIDNLKLNNVDTIISSRMEHHATLHQLDYLSKFGVHIKFVKNNEQGELDLDDLENILKLSQNSLVSLLYVNNETGVINDVKNIVRISKQYKALVHLDTVKASDREYLKLIASQVKTLDVLPIVPIEIRTKEVQYQLVGARILYPAFEVELESIGKDGRSDLKFKKSGEVTNYVGEYKLWSNKSNNPVDQCLNYFLSETESGFVFMANDSHSNIWSDYVTKYVKGSATFINDNSDSFLLTEDKNYVNIYCSYHLCPISAKRVAIYHFIYNLHGNFGTRPQAIKKPKAKKVSSK